MAINIVNKRTVKRRASQATAFLIAGAALTSGIIFPKIYVQKGRAHDRLQQMVKKGDYESANNFFDEMQAKKLTYRTDTEQDLQRRISEQTITNLRDNLFRLIRKNEYVEARDMLNLHKNKIPAIEFSRLSNDVEAVHPDRVLKNINSYSGNTNSLALIKQTAREYRQLGADENEINPKIIDAYIKVINFHLNSDAPITYTSNTLSDLVNYIEERAPETKIEQSFLDSILKNSRERIEKKFSDYIGGSDLSSSLIRFSANFNAISKKTEGNNERMSSLFSLYAQNLGIVIENDSCSAENKESLVSMMKQIALENESIPREALASVYITSLDSEFTSKKPVPSLIDRWLADFAGYATKNNLNFQAPKELNKFFTYASIYTENLEDSGFHDANTAKQVTNLFDNAVKISAAIESEENSRKRAEELLDSYTIYTRKIMKDSSYNTDYRIETLQTLAALSKKYSIDRTNVVLELLSEIDYSEKSSSAADGLPPGMH